MAVQCQKPARTLYSDCYDDEPVWGFEDKYSVQCDHPVSETMFGGLEEVLFRFQACSDVNPNRAVDEKKQQRMVLNRESARRSRLRKKRIVENLAMELNRLKVQNRELEDRFSAAVCLNWMVRRENDWLNAESLALSARLGKLSQILLARQLINQDVFKCTFLLDPNHC